MGEFAAHLYGWTQLLSRAVVAALVARGIGSILVLVFGKHLLQHNFYFVNEDSFGIIAQLIVSLFVLLGLKVNNKLKWEYFEGLLMVYTIDD